MSHSPEVSRPVVALRRVGDHAGVSEAVDSALDLLDEPFAGLHAGATVLIKPNMFQTRPGFQADPDLVAAVARRVADHGARPVVAERTHQIYTVLRDHPIHRIARVISLDDCPLRVAAITEASSLRVPIAVPDIVLDCDFFIGIPQLRTHASVVFSNALKNLVGLLPGYTTRIVHMAGVDESTIDLNLLRPQHLVVCDATTVIEGNYPMDGTARSVGIVAAGRNAVAVDVVMGEVAGFDVSEVAYLRDAHQRGMGPRSMVDIEVRGNPAAELAFAMAPAPTQIRPPRPGIHVYADTACGPCQRYLAGAMAALRAELLAWPGELTVLAGAMVELPPLRGTVVVVGNALYERRDLGIYVEGCPPRAIQLAAFRHAMGQQVSEHERTQFRVPVAAPSAAVAGT